SQESRSAGSYLHDLCDEISSNAAWAKDWRCLDAGIFDNGTSPQRIWDLRQRDGASLTDEEKAILIAADKFGLVEFCKSVAGNAFLIEHQGRPAIVASGHNLIDFKSNKFKCAGKRNRPEYFPNFTYLNPNDRDEGYGYYTKTIFETIKKGEIERIINGKIEKIIIVTIMTIILSYILIRILVRTSCRMETQDRFLETVPI